MVIGQVTLCVSDLDAIGRKKTEQVDAVLLYLRYRGVPADVRSEIVRFIEYMWTSGQAEHETAGLETLPDSLKLRLDLALKQQLIKKVPLFEDLPPTGVVAVVRALQSLVVIPKEVIVHEGHEGHEMFFIGSGSVRVYKRCDERGGRAARTVELAQLNAGSFFGEMVRGPRVPLDHERARLTFCPPSRPFFHRRRGLSLLARAIEAHYTHRGARRPSSPRPSRLAQVVYGVAFRRLPSSSPVTA